MIVKIEITLDGVSAGFEKITHNIVTDEGLPRGFAMNELNAVYVDAAQFIWNNTVGPK